MAATEVQGANVHFMVRDFGTTDVFKEMVCEDTLLLDLSNDVSTTKTKCGTMKGISVADFKANGSGVCNLTPTVTEYSYNELLDDQNVIQKKEFVIENKAFGAHLAGALIRVSGGGYFSTSQFNGSNGEACKFTWSFEGVGTLNTTES